MTSGLFAPVERSGTRAASIRTLLPFFGLYVSFGATFGLIGAGASLMLRAQGTSLAGIGVLQLIYLPLTMSFLWAPVVDRIRLPFLSPRVAYVVASQLATVLLVIILAVAVEAGTMVQAGWLFVILLGVSASEATMDIALEALVVDTVSTERRSPITTAKLCGSALGGMAGIGLVTMPAKTISLPGALTVVAAIDALLVMPILFYPEPLRPRRSTGSARGFARIRGGLVRAVTLGLYFAAGILVSENPGLVLLDLHVPLATAGLVTGTVIPATGLVMTLVSGVLAGRAAAGRLVAILGAGVIASTLLLALAAFTASPMMAAVAASLDAAFLSLLGVPVFNLLYRWAEGSTAATDYALLFGLASLVAMPARVGAPVLAGALGWSGYFLLATPLYAIAVWWLRRAMCAPSAGTTR